MALTILRSRKKQTNGEIIQTNLHNLGKVSLEIANWVTSIFIDFYQGESDMSQNNYYNEQPQQYNDQYNQNFGATQNGYNDFGNTNQEYSKFPLI